MSFTMFSNLGSLSAGDRLMTCYLGPSSHMRLKQAEELGCCRVCASRIPGSGRSRSPRHIEALHFVTRVHLSGRDQQLCVGVSNYCYSAGLYSILFLYKPIWDLLCCPHNRTNASHIITWWRPTTTLPSSSVRDPPVPSTLISKIIGLLKQRSMIDWKEKEIATSERLRVKAPQECLIHLGLLSSHLAEAAIFTFTSN